MWRVTHTRALLCAAVAAALAGCVTLPPNSKPAPQDPWESWNRGVYKVNDKLDQSGSGGWFMDDEYVAAGAPDLVIEDDVRHGFLPIPCSFAQAPISEAVPREQTEAPRPHA